MSINRPQIKIKIIDIRIVNLEAVPIQLKNEWILFFKNFYINFLIIVFYTIL